MDGFAKVVDMLIITASVRNVEKRNEIIRSYSRWVYLPLLDSERS